VLRFLVVGNLLASGAHFVHNAIFLDSYPGPTWIPGPWFIVVAWMVVASTLLTGYFWHQSGRRGHALVAITAYCVSCLFVFCHYLYGSPTDFDALTNLLIILEGVGGVVLFTYFVAITRNGTEAGVT
jgi:hypothetical protein